EPAGLRPARAEAGRGHRLRPRLRSRQPARLAAESGTHPVSFRSSNDRIIGIDLGGTKIFGGLVDPFGEIEHETYVAHGGGPSTTADLLFERLVELVHTLAGQALASGCKVRGVGVGAPGITRADGVVV